MLEQRTLSVEGQSVHCAIAGEGPPLLFLHGWPTHSGLYRDIIPAVSAHRKAIAIDLPGFGQSSKPTDVRYSFSFFRRVIDGVLEQLDIDDVGLVIHDLGGPVGLHWAVENPRRVRELVVLNTLAFADFHWAVKLFVAMVSLPVVAQALTSPYGIRASIKLGMTSSPTSSVLEAYTKPFADRAARRALAMAGRHLSVGKLAQTAKKLNSLEVPTLLMYGTRDKILPDVDRTMSRLQAIWPHATKIPLSGQGHFLQEDVPELVATNMVEFLTRAA
ncbi:MAG: alpha/beta fold hydrolase [Myxococcota bacterium]